MPNLIYKGLCIVLVAAVSGCGGGGSSSDTYDSNVSESSGRYTGNLSLVGSTCQGERVLETLPYELEITPTGLSSGVSHLIDVIGDNKQSVNSWIGTDISESLNGYISQVDLVNFDDEYFCNESTTLKIQSADDSMAVPSIIRVERSSYVNCVKKNNPDVSKQCDVYYLGEMFGGNQN